MSKRTSRRTPDETRQAVLFAAFEEIHRHGFRAASLDAIAARAGVTKGALYHHFPEKAALGLAVVEEVVREPLLAAYVGPLRRGGDDPIGALQEALRRRADDFEHGGVEFGCPLNNLAQEMSPLDEDFRASVAAVIEAWTDAFADGLARALAQGLVRPECGRPPRRCIPGGRRRGFLRRGEEFDERGASAVQPGSARRVPGDAEGGAVRVERR